MLTLSEPFRDQRGAFTRFFCKESLEPWIGQREIAQISHSCTSEEGTLRGMHYQKAPHEELKIVRCIRGRVWDVAVDLRADSPTRYQWHGEELSAENNRIIIIPEGFAHGFQALEPDTELLYLITTPYQAEAQAGLHPLDPALGIEWPLPIGTLSDRDANFAKISQGSDDANV